MRQPEPPNAVEQLRDFLFFAVPFCATEHTYKIKSRPCSHSQAVAWLTREAERAGPTLGTCGDSPQFTPGHPPTATSAARTAGTAGGMVAGTAAASLLAQLDGRDGVSVFGDYYGIRRNPVGLPNGSPPAPVAGPRNP